MFTNNHPRVRKKTHKIREFIARNIDANKSSIVSLVSDKFGISRQAAHQHLSNLMREGLVAAIGRTRGTSYALIPLVQDRQEYPLDKGVEDHIIWREVQKRLVGKIQENVIRICEHGVSEMVNNVNDHSNAANLIVSVEQTLSKITVTIVDNGVGIFNKLTRELGLEDPRHAILELYKGKVTTDPENHSGEGIFFTSRMVDKFTIFSGSLYFSHLETGSDYLLDEKYVEQTINGTVVILEVNTFTQRTAQSVFDEYASSDEGFSKTKVPVLLVKQGNENLVSRSQARRLLMRLDRFQEIILDFEGVSIIGQAFSDEIFRVFASKNPNIEIVSINKTHAVDGMINRVKASSQLPLL